MIIREVIVTETTVSQINGVDISCGNIYKRNRKDKEGYVTKEMSVTFRINVKDLHILFLNDTINFGEETWRLKEFKKGEIEARSKVIMEKVI